jgi:hypothetical protein
MEIPEGAPYVIGKKVTCVERCWKVGDGYPTGSLMDVLTEIVSGRAPLTYALYGHLTLPLILKVAEIHWAHRESSHCNRFWVHTVHRQQQDLTFTGRGKGHASLAAS